MVVAQVSAEHGSAGEFVSRKTGAMAAIGVKGYSAVMTGEAELRCRSGLTWNGIERCRIGVQGKGGDGGRVMIPEELSRSVSIIVRGVAGQADLRVAPGF